jgi:hypothetical protein
MKLGTKRRAEVGKSSLFRVFFFIPHPLSFILLFLLVACGESPTPTTVTQANQTPTTNSSPVTAPISTAANSTGAVVVSPAATAAPAATATPTAVVAQVTFPVGSTSDRDQVLKAVRKLAQDTQSFRYNLQQRGELKSGSSLTQFAATGAGEWQRPAFHQLISLSLGGQTQKVEDYSRDRELFERVVELVVWRKQAFTIAGPFPDPARVEQAGNFKAMGKETIGSQAALKFSWEEPASRLLPPAGQPEGLGALSATNLYRAFTGDGTSTAQLTLWVDETSGAPLRYQLVATFSAANTTLNYTATYDYTGLNDSAIKVDAPSDLIK